MTRQNFIPPTPRMWGYLFGLAGERALASLGADETERVANLQAMQDERTLDKFQAMSLIDELKEAPLDLANSPIQPGVYMHNGEILTVQLNRDGTRLYAKRLVEIGGKRLNAEGEHVKIDFNYAPGMLSKLKPSERMTWEAAKPFVIRYGMCLFGHPLKDATSVELGIGPVCRRMFSDFAKPPAPEVKPETSAALAALLNS